MRDSHGGPFGSPALVNPMKYRAQITALAPGNGPGRLRQNPPQILVPFASPRAQLLARTLIDPWAQTCPTGTMTSIRKYAHIGPQLSNQTPSRQPIHTGNGRQPVHLLLVGRHGCPDAPLQPFPA